MRGMFVLSRIIHSDFNKINWLGKSGEHYYKHVIENICVFLRGDREGVRECLCEFMCFTSRAETSRHEDS